MKFVIAGCGLAGAVSARLLSDAGHQVKVYETRNHIAGNCYDSNVSGTMVHNYGPHIFHTDDEEVFAFLSRFTKWMPFELRPVGNTPVGKIPLPYSDDGCKKSLARTFSEEEIKNYIFKDYSEKQWGVPFDTIPKTITNRIPKTKDSINPTWFEGQKYQCIPEEGYTKMFERMLEGIDVHLNCANKEYLREDYDYLIYTGKIDEYFNYEYGELPYRTLSFKHEVTKTKMPSVTQNECNKTWAHTRKYDHSYFTKDHKGTTVITKEYSHPYKEGDIPFYPIPWGYGQDVYAKYKSLAEKELNTIFVGRLATYKYLDMWMVIKHVFLKVDKFIN